ncbi:MAG: hypothetical protein HZB76_04815 [Chlamydiae bacterium]|nr:hypothetical protein [Chlamydiota bacterium]
MRQELSLREIQDLEIKYIGSSCIEEILQENRPDDEGSSTSLTIQRARAHPVDTQLFEYTPHTTVEEINRREEEINFNMKLKFDV